MVFVSFLICNNIFVKGFRSSSVLTTSLAAFLLAAPLTASAGTLHFNLDTASLSGTDAYLAFDLYDSDPASNSATIADFLTDGTLGDATTITLVGGATGTLTPGPVTLTDTAFFNEFLQAITLGNVISFTLNLTQNALSGSPPDSFAFFLLDDAAALPLFETTDRQGGALFAVDIDGTAEGSLYNFAPADTNMTVSWTVEPAAVPLPSTALLISAGLLGGLAARRRGGVHTVAG